MTVVNLQEKQSQMRSRLKSRRGYRPQRPTRIYLIEHPSGIWYVGLTENSIEHRWSEHRTKARQGRGSLLHQKIRELGPEHFQISQLSELPTRRAATDAEKQFIRDMRRTRDGCLNKTLGGATRRLRTGNARLQPRRLGRMTLEQAFECAKNQGWL